MAMRSRSQRLSLTVPILPTTTSPYPCFGKWAITARANGFLPVPTDGKVPMVRNWNKRPWGEKAIANYLAKNPKAATANLGFRTGHLVAIDIDHDDADKVLRMAHLAKAALGETSFVRIGRAPRQVLFYRAEVEIASKKIGKVDILGAGKIAIVAGIHPVTMQHYTWPEDSLLDVDFRDVPLVNSSSVEKLVRWLEDESHASREIIMRKVERIAIEAFSSNSRAAYPGAVHEGERNDALFRWAKERARSHHTYESLLRAALRENSGYRPALPHREVEAVVTSIWAYRKNGSLFVKGEQRTVLPLGKDDILKLPAEATHLLTLLKATRATKRFTIPQKATAKTLGWGSNRVKAAIDSLIDAGHIHLAHPARAGYREQARYGWGRF